MIDHKPDHYWYFAAKNCQLRYNDGRIAEVGVTHEVSGTPGLCRHGLHASRRAIDALRLGAGSVAFQVALGGKIVHGDDKSAAQRRTYLRGGRDMTTVLVEFACCVAEAELLLADVTDDRPWRCIEATRAYMRGKVDRKVLRLERNAAHAAYAAVYAADAAVAAYDAARATSYAAAYAADAAVYATVAAYDAARATSYAAAYAADAAVAVADVKNEINALLETMLLEAMP